jgi:hypothetical protein
MCGVVASTADEVVWSGYGKNRINGNGSLSLWIYWGIVEDSLVVAFDIEPLLISDLFYIAYITSVTNKIRKLIVSNTRTCVNC